MPALGERFRAAREARGLSLSDVAEQIRIRSVYLSAIEDENWNAIGAPVYVRGFLRTYARFLGLEPEEVVGQFNALSPAPASTQAKGSSAGATATDYLGAERAARNLSPLIWVAGAIAVLLVAFVFYSALTMHQRTGVPADVAAASPSPEASAVVSAAPAAAASAGVSAFPNAVPGANRGGDGPHSIQLIISSPSWLRVTVDGSVSMEGTFPAGTVKLFHGKSAVLRIGNAGGVQVSVDGKNLGTLGSAGDVVERSFAL